MKILVFLYLLINGWTDYREREIDLRYTIAFMVCTVVYKVWEGTVGGWWGILPGALLWVFSWNRQEKIGSGDAWVVMAAGWALGFKDIWRILMTAFMMAGIVGVIWLFTGRKKADPIPFIPCLLLGFLAGECLR